MNPRAINQAALPNSPKNLNPGEKCRLYVVQPLGVFTAFPLHLVEKQRLQFFGDRAARAVANRAVVELIVVEIKFGAMIRGVAS